MLLGFQDDHHGSHLGYPNETILALLNLHHQSNASQLVSAQTGLGGDVVLKNFKIGYWNGTILAEFWISMSPQCVPPSNGVNQTGFGSGFLCVRQDFNFYPPISHWIGYQYFSFGYHYVNRCKKYRFCLCWGFTAQSIPWGHVERGQFT